MGNIVSTYLVQDSSTALQEVACNNGKPKWLPLLVVQSNPKKNVFIPHDKQRQNFSLGHAPQGSSRLLFAACDPR